MANRLRELRKGKGLTQACLAQKSNVSRSVIARFETGKTGLSTRNLEKIAKALACRMEDILKGEADGKTAKCG